MEYNENDKAKHFKEELSKLNSLQGKDNMKIPQMGGKELDLYKLFKEVINRGGYTKVLENKLWKDVVNSLEISASCTSASFLLRNHYNKYLFSYEQQYFKSQKDNKTQVTENNINQNNAVNQEKFLNKKIIKPEFEYNMFFRNTKQTWINNKDKTFFKKIRMTNSILDFKKIILAFESHNSSDIIWSLNVLLLYSSNSNISLVLDNQPYLIESIANYIYYCINNISDNQKLHLDKYLIQSNQQQNFNNLGLVENKNKELSNIKKIIPLSMETRIDRKKENNNNNIKQHNINNSNENIINDINLNKYSSLQLLSKKEKNLKSEKRLNDLYKVSLMKDEALEYELQEHLITILLIFRNLSFIKQNEITIIKNSKIMNLIYFLFINSNILEIKLHCLDIINNLSKHILLKEVKYGFLVLNTVFELVKSSYKETSEIAIECLRRLSLPNGNEEMFIKLGDDFYEELINMLISYKQDIRESVLEIIYSISDNIIAKSKLGKQSHCVERLVALLCSSSPDNKIAKYSACILSNLATIPYNQKIIMIFEQEIFLAACLDEALTKVLMGIISN